MSLPGNDKEGGIVKELTLQQVADLFGIGVVQDGGRVVCHSQHDVAI